MYAHTYERTSLAELHDGVTGIPHLNFVGELQNHDSGIPSESSVHEFVFDDSGILKRYSSKEFVCGRHTIHPESSSAEFVCSDSATESGIVVSSFWSLSVLLQNQRTQIPSQNFSKEFLCRNHTNDALKPLVQAGCENGVCSRIEKQRAKLIHSSEEFVCELNRDSLAKFFAGICVR